jgi:rhamnogalacturonyl hydrolase YesR
MITESLNNSVHHKGPHGYGSLLRIDGNVSFHHNLYAHHSSRNPRPGCYGDMERGGMLDFRNNVVYNWGERPGYTAEDKVALNLVANYYRPGPSTATGVRSLAFIVGGASTNMYAAGNVHEGNPAAAGDNWKMVRVEKPEWVSGARLPVPLEASRVATEPAPGAFSRVLERAGAVLPDRDPVDQRIVREVRSGTGRIVDTPGEAGGWPAYTGTLEVRDTDNDGMPDAWETAHGLNPASAADQNGDNDADGYTNVEEFLNATDPNVRDAETIPWSVRIGESFLRRHPDAVTYDSGSPNQRWNYEQGLMLTALWRLGEHTGDARYHDFVRRNLERYVNEDGSISTYTLADYNLDNIAPGRALLAVYRESGQEKFRRAADTLRQQLRGQPRTNEGGFWHKKIYPYQMWLDGLFMAQPFAAVYTETFGDAGSFDDIVKQFLLVGKHTRDSATGLFYHGWDESRQQRWADPATGRSPSFWARAMGWYMMALVDVLDVLPADHPGREQLLSILRGLAPALLRFRDPGSHLWYQVVDQGNREGNYLEASASAMFAYGFARGANRGYLPPEYRTAAESTFAGLTSNMVTQHPDGSVDLRGTCRSAGLGNKPYRDGSFAYYISEPQRVNDMKGLGPLLLAAIELEQDHRP